MVNEQFTNHYNEFGYENSKNENRIVRKSFYKAVKRFYIRTEIIDLITGKYTLSETCRKINDVDMQLQYSNVIFSGMKYDKLDKIFCNTKEKILSNSPSYYQKVVI